MNILSRPERVLIISGCLNEHLTGERFFLEVIRLKRTHNETELKLTLRVVITVLSQKRDSAPCLDATDAQVAIFGRQNESPVSWLSNEPKIEP